MQRIAYCETGNAAAQAVGASASSPASALIAPGVGAVQGEDATLPLLAEVGSSPFRNSNEPNPNRANLSLIETRVWATLPFGQHDQHDHGERGDRREEYSDARTVNQATHACPIAERHACARVRRGHE